MATLYPKAFAELYCVDEDDVRHDLDYTTLTVRKKVNAGWSLSATLPNEFAFIDSPRTLKFYARLVDGLGGDITTPTLYCPQRESDDETSEGGGGASLSGQCRTSDLMSRDNYSTATFRATDSRAIVAHLAAVAGVEMNPETVPLLNVPDEDVKGQQLNRAIERFYFVGACEWHVDLTGKVQTVPWGNRGGELEIDYSSIKRKVDHDKRFSGMAIGKTSAVLGNSAGGDFSFPFDSIGFKSFALPGPISNAIPSDLSTLGYIDWVAFFDGDPTGGGRLIAFNAFRTSHPILGTSGESGFGTGEAFAGAWPATHCSCVVFASAGGESLLGTSEVVAKLRVVGSPPSTVPAGVEAEFYVPCADSTWPAQDWIDSLFPSKVYAQANYSKYLAMKSKGWDSLTMEAVLHCDVDLFQKFLYRDVPYKVDEVEWSVSADGVPLTRLEIVRHEPTE